MKKIRIIAALVLSLCLLGLSAFAAEFTPSVEDKDVVPGEAQIYDKDGHLLVSSQEDGSVAYVLDKNGNKIWEASETEE